MINGFYFPHIQQFWLTLNIAFFFHWVVFCHVGIGQKFGSPIIGNINPKPSVVPSGAQTLTYSHLLDISRSFSWGFLHGFSHGFSTSSWFTPGKNSAPFLATKVASPGTLGGGLDRGTWDLPAALPAVHDAGHGLVIEGLVSWSNTLGIYRGYIGRLI